MTERRKRGPLTWSGSTRWALASLALTSILTFIVWLVVTDAPSIRFVVQLYRDKHFLKSTVASWGWAAPLVFIGIPFVVRTVQPVLEDLEREVEEAAATLGASRWRVIRSVLFPLVAPALLTGFALAFARAVGEYGSVIFIAGNMPMKTEIVPLLIVTKLEQFDYPGATALALVMLAASFVMLLIINGLQAWIRRHGGEGEARK